MLLFLVYTMINRAKIIIIFIPRKYFNIFFVSSLLSDYGKMTTFALIFKVK